jgi:hypothetical protein
MKRYTLIKNGTLENGEVYIEWINILVTEKAILEYCKTDCIEDALDMLKKEGYSIKSSE